MFIRPFYAPRDRAVSGRRQQDFAAWEWRILSPVKVNRQFALEAYSHREAVRGYSRAVGRVGLWKCERSSFRSHLPADGRILDLGCGAGRTTFGLYDEGYRDIIGVDLSPEMIRQARAHSRRRRQRIPFRVADACRLPFRARSFEGCLFSFNGLMTIPRLSSRIAALREVRRVLVPGGRFVFTTHERVDEATPRSFWRKQRDLWAAGRQDPQLHEVGDQFVDELGRPTFVHVPDRREVLECLAAASLERVEDRCPDLTRESTAVKAFIGSRCRFWVARRPI
jgi:SAM-dependent methyltransferase